jgi:hypothetical protein
VESPRSGKLGKTVMGLSVLGCRQCLRANAMRSESDFPVKVGLSVVSGEVKRMIAPGHTCNHVFSEHDEKCYQTL